MRAPAYSAGALNWLKRCFRGKLWKPVLGSPQPPWRFAVMILCKKGASASAMRRARPFCPRNFACGG